MAADLMGVDSVMLYQTAAFVKFPGNGETRWHSDLNTAPFDTNHMLTFWIALTPVPSLDEVRAWGHAPALYVHWHGWCVSINTMHRMVSVYT